MSVYKCKMCGGNLDIINEENGLCECDSCGSTQTVPLQDDMKKAELYNTANEYRKNNRFDRAADVYKNMIQEFPDEAEAYWGMVLSRYGIEYVEDPATKKMIPTCHRTIPVSIFEDSDYRLACEKAKPLARQQYEKEAAVIDQIQKKIFMLVNREEPYDIFISYKELDDNSKERTVDSVLAQDIYERLVAEGYKVFFSRITLENRLGEDYEPIIYSALRTSKIMLLVGTSRDHMNAPWVRNEWTRYLDMMDENPGKKTLIPVYSRMDPYDIPGEISGRHLQAQNADKIGFKQDLLHGIRKIMQGSHSTVAPVNYVASGHTNTGGMIERGFICLKDRNFQEAQDVFNKVLDIDPHSGGAYLGRLMIKRGVSSIEQLKEQVDPMTQESDYQHAVEYGEAKIKKTLRDYEKNIIAANREKALEFIKDRLDKLEDSVQNMRQDILDAQAEITHLTEVIAEKNKLVEQDDKAVAAMNQTRKIILIIHLILWAPDTIGSLFNGDIGSFILDVVVAYLIWRYILGKFVAVFIQKIVGKFKGKIDDLPLAEAIQTINTAQQSISEKTNTIAYTQTEVENLDNKIKMLRANTEQAADRMALMARRNMTEELTRIIG